ncbi:hypothetical protein C6495_01200 [Candidatus Poribacteria bacterium]|nr:MAG: hypothetical protein C6495_01200 [Candidatus Poribacteria bacterium]
MKFSIFFLIGLCLISASALGELSVDDLDKIRDIVKESEDRLRAEIALVRAENAASEARTNKQLDRNFTLLVALFGFVAVVTGIPLTLVALQLRKERDRDEQLNTQQQQLQEQQRQLREQQRVIEALQLRIEDMSQELATLKAQRIIR